MARMPTLFISHGSPMLAVADSAARRFLQGSAPRLPPPARGRRDFGALRYSDDRGNGRGAARDDPRLRRVPRRAYRLRYPAPGQPELARDIAGSIERRGLPRGSIARRGLDHGAWIPLSLMFPRADVPVVQVSIDSARSPEQHWALGRALRPLRDAGALLLRLRRRDAQSRAVCPRARPQRRKPAARVGRGVQRVDGRRHRGRRFDDLFRYRESAPYAAQNHPTPEHFLPLFVTLGAAYDEEPGVRIHASYDRGLLSLDAYAFGFAARSARDPHARARRRRPTLLSAGCSHADKPSFRGSPPCGSCCSSRRSSCCRSRQPTTTHSGLEPPRVVHDLAGVRVRRRDGRRVRDAYAARAASSASSSWAMCRSRSSLFLVASLVAMIAFRVFVEPLFS